ncbi:hypothetical protein [Staphylococcus intermedius]|uniref:Uncharacterized protein n=1 Tax=Staphylococcus intermedius NCTC 11048 TaxID=1141106 RepID=A0A380FZA0_STAIN|nr:hypothetical protein [Staphylococcus intermedius]PCF83896.1 hypothetical protein B4W76_12465 [Staphylococcus intermedius]PNZ50252.1 hypothetical protein CD138_11895 [Staphylococcus intermedius NCTC 11048]SUM43597.1 Uncharacterised protein [Staphylococcus intermedius NCTC 11048]
MQQIESLGLTLGVILLFLTAYVFYVLIKLLRKIYFKHKYTRWYVLRDFLVSLGMLILVTVLFTIVSTLYMDTLLPISISGMSEDALKLLHGSVAIFRSFLLLSLLLPLFLLALYFIYVNIFIIIRFRKQRKNNNTNNLLKAIHDKDATKMIEIMKQQVNTSNNINRRLLYFKNDSLLLQTLIDHKEYKLANHQNNIMKNKKLRKFY